MRFFFLIFPALGFPLLSLADIPNAIPHQGRISVNGINFDGPGQFKFLLFGDEDADHNSGNELAVWSNTTTTPADMSEPAAAVPLVVTTGHYSVWLGDTDTTNMAALPAEFDPSDKQLYLRIWFNDGTTGFEQLAPDQAVGSAPYALLAMKSEFATQAGQAQSVEAGAVGSAQIQNESILGIDISTSAVSTSEVLDGSLLLVDLDLQDIDTRYTPQNAQTIVVDASGGAAFTTIGAAVASVTPTAANPVVIEVRSGTYAESVTLKNFLHLKGAGMDHCTVFPPSTGPTDSKAFRLNNLSGVRISGFTFNAQAASNADAGIDAVQSSFSVHDCRFVDINSSFGVSAETGGIVSSDSKPVIFRCEFDVDSNGIVLLDDSNALIHSCEFGEASAFEPQLTGIRSFGSDCRIIGNSFSRHSLGFVSDVRPGVTASKIVIVGNRFSEVGEAINIEPLVTATITGNTFEGDRSGERGIVNSGVALISGNTFCDLGGFAVVAGGLTTNLNGNHIENCGPSGGQASAIDGGTVTVSGNSFANNFRDFGPNAPNVGLAWFDSVHFEADPGSGLLAGPRLGVGPTPFEPTVEFEVRGQSIFAGPADFSSTVTFSGMTGLDNGLDVTGMTALNGDADVVGELTVTETAALQGGVQTTDINSLGNITATGIVNADDYTFPSAKTFTYQIPGNTMLPNTEGEDFFRSTLGYIRQEGSNTVMNVIAPVRLPDGAVITSVEVLYYDNTANNYGATSPRLRRRDYDQVQEQNVATLNFTPSGTASNSIKTASLNLTASRTTIDNDTYQYWVNIDLNAATPDNNLRFYGFRIEYTLDTLSP